ncbi:MAG: DUF1838 family protein, partial [Rhodospirillaceae bacterium]|nr:DUF1838 family protein [Rhodospirillaceae bacterium]
MAASAEAPTAPPPPPPTDTVMQTYARMRGAPNSGLALWWYTGTVWGKQPDEMARPLFRVQGLTFNRITRAPDGSITQKLTGRGWYADVKTGAPLDTFTNPLTGERLTPPHIKSLQTQIIAADGTMPPRDEPTLDTFDGRIGDLTVSGDTIWLTENFVAKYKPDAARGGAVNTTSSLSTFTARIKDIENTAADFVPAYLNYQSLGSWPAWMKMGAAPGVLSWQTRGQKVRGPEAAPQALREWIEARYPGFLAAP